MWRRGLAEGAGAEGVPRCGRTVGKPPPTHLICPRVQPGKVLTHMALHCATVCPGLKVDLPPSHRVLQLQLPSLTLPQFLRRRG